MKQSISVFVMIIIAAFCSNVLAQEDTVSIDYFSVKGNVEERIFGNNLLGHDPKLIKPELKEYLGNVNFGAGIWDSKWDVSVKEVVKLAKDIDITILRFPGGCGAHHYNWRKTVGKERNHFLYGVDEFLKTRREIGAEAIFTLSYFEGDEQGAADLVRYTKGEITYFEIGNEDYHGDHQKIKQVLPEEYAKKYLRYYESMKAADPSIKIGAILYTEEWNEKVMAAIKDKLDFGIVHIYPTPASGKNLSKFPAKEIFTITLALPEAKYQDYLKDALRVLEKYSGRKIPLAVTEFNGGFAQDEPVPYRHTLLCALVNAELLRIFMKPENNILMACYWNFCNEYWGMVANGFNGNPKDLYNPYYKRPNYYVFEMYAKHFGDMLVDVDVKCDTYEYENNKIPYLSVNASKNKDGNKLYLMVINKNMDKPETATIELKDFIPAKEGNAWVLNGPSVDATNEEKHDNVKVTHKMLEIASSAPSALPRNDGDSSSASFEYTFEPHSLTAIELTRYENPADK